MCVFVFLGSLEPFCGRSACPGPSPVLAQLLSHEPTFLAVRLSPGSLPHGRHSSLWSGWRPERSSQGKVPLASWPPRCSPLQAGRSRSGPTRKGTADGMPGPVRRGIPDLACPGRSTLLLPSHQA